MVGGGSFTGFGLSSDFDAHVYLLDGGDGACALVDCGMGSAAGMARVLARIEAAGVDPGSIETLLLTHFHTDHAGGAARYRERLGAAVAIGRDAAAALEAGDHTATQFAPAQAAGIFPADYTYPPCPVDDPLADGDVRSVGRLRCGSSPPQATAMATVPTWLPVGSAPTCLPATRSSPPASCSCRHPRLRHSRFDRLAAAARAGAVHRAPPRPRPGACWTAAATTCRSRSTLLPSCGSHPTSSETEDSIMIKLIGTARRRDDLTMEAFIAYWNDVHAPISARPPGLRGYVVSEVTRRLAGELEVDAFVEQWWDDLDAYKAAAAPDEAAAAWEDVANYARTDGNFWIAREHVLRDAAPTTTPACCAEARAASRAGEDDRRRQTPRRLHGGWRSSTTGATCTHRSAARPQGCRGT